MRPDSTGPVFQPNAHQMGGAWSARPGVGAPAAYTTSSGFRSRYVRGGIIRRVNVDWPTPMNKCSFPRWPLL